MSRPPAAGEGPRRSRDVPTSRASGLPAPPWGIFVGGAVPGHCLPEDPPIGDLVGRHDPGDRRRREQLAIRANPAAEAMEEDGVLVKRPRGAVRSILRDPALVGREIVVDLKVAQT